MQHNYQDLINLFEQTFFNDYNTRLVKGDHEPLYAPATDMVNFHRIIFAHGYFTSALHEIAHWCIAGEHRRTLEDYGYWYHPDGRSSAQQKQFEQVEVKPQAIEWAFCVVAGIKFHVSADNLHGDDVDSIAFRYAVYQQVRYYISVGFPVRAQQFITALAEFYQSQLPLTDEQFIFDQELYADV
ncbi:elongation factor P hydroxylase [Thalassotalea sp. 1_MG-2023]|uniref:elongation factor P hydroxylase n=1 Tax=Thalassotalea sp. 1_MG-2023 TaxID=3062680 RepID=UPI0026E304EC|nr:elongation factor P hydroxylase [Thalassotalea sp. 1_MG-2023]MDO6426620.1 elongation factor P hydroxylase [Thalassotalea sp. 1_MG-2023]